MKTSGACCGSSLGSLSGNLTPPFLACIGVPFPNMEGTQRSKGLDWWGERMWGNLVTPGERGGCCSEITLHSWLQVWCGLWIWRRGGRQAWINLWARYPWRRKCRGLAPPFPGGRGQQRNYLEKHTRDRSSPIQPLSKQYQWWLWAPV